MTNLHGDVRLDHSLLAVDGEHDVHAMLELVAPEAPAGDGRAPLSLALVIDRSGSMAGEKLDAAKRCAEWLVSRLEPTDELALVDYDDQVRLLAPRAPVHEARLRHAIAGIWPGGMTNLSGGWLKGLEELDAAAPERVRKILLLSDGHANEGITDAAALASLARSGAGERIGTTTIGFGDGFDEDLMTGIADAAGGNAHFAATPDEAPAIFAEEFEGLTTLVAQNVSVEIRPGPNVEVLGVLNEYPAVAVPGGVQVALGDAYGGERRRVVFAFHIPDLAALGPVPVAELVLRYVSVGDEIAQHELKIPVVANAVSAAEAAQAAPDPEVREEVIVLKAARARDDAIRLADDGRYDDAQRLLAETAAEARAAGLAEEADKLTFDFDLAAPAAYTSDGMARKQLRYASNQARRRRLR